MNTSVMVWGMMGTGLASALVSGVFLSFSDFTMRSLRMADPAAGSQAMQILNREIFRSLFMVLLIGLVPVAAGIGIAVSIWTPVAGTALMLLGSVFYVFGVFGVTVLGNVPKNERLAAMPDGGVAAQAYWPDYVRTWVRWNHVRTLFSGLTAGCFVSAALLIAQAG
ncbi:DUF1772 domain-containing protein [Sulfitobacter aestuariivivens]|uniref:DUF1772 domain-containing protein n=1 Tax=Sulfitobacter aestuariivivens TaxID=2766981 RepID=A0A927HFP7_9RHOB|nr:anthrone oxygenase family protein [Sulfitobacter aestuariivivens]MBD3666067.1 DUF1772 domain-containing protein [Sulfitobacter aestuariivivens]